MAAPGGMRFEDDIEISERSERELPSTWSQDDLDEAARDERDDRREGWEP